MSNKDQQKFDSNKESYQQQVDKEPSNNLAKAYGSDRYDNNYGQVEQPEPAEIKPLKTQENDSKDYE